ncbi:MAG: hypothetical protein LBL70_03455 [Treponema sp.]|jgi:hypothetical protein|nr:hypothetical protein [Treponema sp.]
MKKTLILLVTAVLACVFIVSCEQPESPTSLDITHHAPGVGGVAGNTIKAEAVDGGILVSWGAGNEAASYQIWRRELNNGSPVAGTTTQFYFSSSNYTANKRIPYYWDTAITNGTVYQYGIVVVGYKGAGNGEVEPYSDIVWQAANQAATGKGVIKSGDRVPFTPVKGGLNATFEKINTTITTGTGGNVDTPEWIKVTVTGLTYGQNYSFRVDYKTGSIATELDWAGFSSYTSSWSIDVDYSTSGIASGYLDDDSSYIFTFSPSNAGGPAGPTHLPGSSSFAAARVVATITGIQNEQITVITPPNPSSDVLPSNQVVISSTNLTY